MKYAKEFGCAGQMLPILINYMVRHHTLFCVERAVCSIYGAERMSVA